MYTGVSGLQANGLAVSVIGDNIANVNTIGFKGSRGNFDDVLQQTILGRAGSTSQLGGGVILNDVQHMFTQGALMNTGQSSDLAISGSGFFVVNGTYNGVQGNFYTRAGQFSVNQDGFLVNPAGLRVQGYTVDSTGQLGGTIGDLNITSHNIPPNPTTSMEITANLNSDEVVLAAPWNVADAAGTSNFNTTITSFDSLGNSHQVEVYFRKTAANSWDWHAVVDGGELAGGVSGTPTEIADGTLGFTTNGELDTEVVNANTVNFLGAAPGQVIDFDFGDSITTDSGTGLAGTTGFAGSNSINFQRQDGFATGTMQSMSITPDGVIMGGFSNGEVQAVGQLALADFQSVAGLDRSGGNLWIQTRDSGEALVGAPNSGARGAIHSYALEQSNVDLAEQFVHLISAQRGYQANSKIITTSDQMLQDTLNMKR
jgi:flagellar hook protein FlgE